MRRAGEVSRFRVALVMLALLALALAGCAGQSAATGSGSAAATSAPATVAPAPTEAATMAAPTEAAAAPTTAASSAATVMLAKNDKLGDILADDKGMTLYLYTKDTKNVSNCYDQCATNWPPLLTTDKAAAGEGVDASLLGVTTRKDGAMQVTYNGWPLYYWFKDQKPGDATGQDVGGVWYVVNAAGEEVETPGGASESSAAATATPASDDMYPSATDAPASSGAAAGSPTVMLAKNDKLGDILADDKGMTLYLYTKDTKNVSNCYDQCATNWPPLLTTDKAAAGEGVDASLLGVTTRKDGAMQVTYNGWPLYYWFKDQKPGDATGQDVGGVWYVVNAAGEEVETPGGS